jgi:translation initiation factor eIF-2B subunit epsilon
MASKTDKAEQPLQAILLADSFTKTFRPISLEKPKMLQPLVNVPMLHYTIEFLASAGVEEVNHKLAKNAPLNLYCVLRQLFIFCVNNKDMFDEFLASQDWTLKITVISSTSCLSAGDALREV